jgi:tetratricopeptide (TPR) repeat protein
MTFMKSLAPSSRRARGASPRGILTGLLVLSFLASGASACSPEKLLGDKALPPDVPDPKEAATPAGALAAYRGAIMQLRSAFGGNEASFIPVTGLLTDELQSGEVGQIGLVSDPLLVDSRFLPEDPGIGADSTTAFPAAIIYGELQKVRGQARQARGALRAYAPDSSPALPGHLDAIEGYAAVFLADLFCSGVPLSTLDFDGDFTYAAGSSTEEVYERALALFDSALVLASDSAGVMNLARVGKGRALLALGRYAEAGAAVTEVPDDFQYAFEYCAAASPGQTGYTMNRSFVYSDFNVGAGGMMLSLVDAEGVNGLPYLSSGDPRTPWDTSTTYRESTILHPAAYPLDGSGSIVLASGVEARLIEAEAQLQAGAASWLATLNALRTDGTFDTQPNAQDTTKTDTLWHAGSGGVAGLEPLQDPGTPEARVDLLFQERAYWLFLTGHRQGDLRRLVREYGRNAEAVYPTGSYPGAFNTYGGDVTAPIPGDERVSNPRFTGCRSRGA